MSFTKSLKSTKSRRGFTLLEIMIVVMIIVMLLPIAMPNYILTRHAAHTEACISNLKQIYSAKQQWAMDNGKSGSATPGATDLFGMDK